MPSLQEAIQQGLSDLVHAVSKLEELRSQWAGKVHMETNDELNAALAEHSIMMPLHQAQMRDNPAMASTLKPHIDKLTTNTAYVLELKSVMGMMETIQKDLAALNERAWSVAAASESAFKA